jgi:ribonuclease P protein component
MNATAPSPRRRDFPRSRRLRRPQEFEAVRTARAVKNAGPLRIAARPGRLPHHRLGLVVSRRAGNAVVRNRIKRMLREAFRGLQHDLPGGYDLVVGVRAHEPAALADYRRWIAEAVGQLDELWQRRGESK